jgi:sugar lactone lactonase YvrE
VTDHDLAGGFNALVGDLALTEAPWWEPATNSVVFVDVVNGGVWDYGVPGDELNELFPRRRGIGGVIGTRAGEFVIGGRDVALLRGGDLTSLCGPTDVDESMIGINDLCADPSGRIVFGVLSFHPLGDTPPTLGALARREHDGSVRVLADDVVLPNGLCFNGDDTVLYVCDSASGAVLRYDVTEDDGLRRRGEIHCDDGGRPDGIAMDECGHLWVARAEAEVIDVIDVDGTVLARHPFPGGAATNLSFGGATGNTLYVTGGGVPPDTRPGGLWSAQANVRGLPVHRAEVARPN